MKKPADTEAWISQGLQWRGFDYKDDAAAYELEELSRPDEMAMIDAAADWAKAALDNRANAALLDLCCGTGLSLRGILGHPGIGETVGVDISSQYLAFARQRFAQVRSLRLIRGDAVDCVLPERHWDVIVLCSAYHHIEDERKVGFLEKVRALLKPGGVALVAENILPPYAPADSASYSDAVRFFYREVLSTAEASNPDLPDQVRGLILRVAQYGCDGDYEYKSSMEVFLRHVGEAGLSISRYRKVWPTEGPLCVTTGGNYVFALQRPADGRFGVGPASAGL